MTLNSAYKKIFGEVLEPLGFKCITRQPYIVRVIDGEILHVIAMRKEPMMIKGETDFSIKSAQSPAHYMNFFVLYAFSFGITAFAKLL